LWPRFGELAERIGLRNAAIPGRLSAKREELSVPGTLAGKDARAPLAALFAAIARARAHVKLAHCLRDLAC
jgi:hypothetical protein